MTAWVGGRLSHHACYRIFLMFVKFVASDIRGNAIAAARHKKEYLFGLFYTKIYHLLRKVMARSDDEKADFFEDKDTTPAFQFRK